MTKYLKIAVVIVFLAPNALAQPSWVENQGEDYNNSRHVYGFGIATISKKISLVDARNRSLANAKKDLSERIYLSIESKTASAGGFNNTNGESSYQEKFETVTTSFSQVEIVNLEKKEYEDKERYYTLVYVPREKLNQEYTKKWRVIDDDINQSYQIAEAKLRSQRAEALRVANSIFKKIDDRNQIETILFSLDFTPPTGSAKSYSDIKKLINQIQNVDVQTLSDLSFNLVNNLNNQIPEIQGEVLVKPFDYLVNDLPSPLSKVLSDEIENDAIQNTAWQIARRDTYNPNGSYNFLKGSYKLSGQNVKFRIVIDNPAKGILASYQIDIPLSVLERSGLDYIPRQKATFKKEQLSPSGLKLDVWTNKGQSDLLFVEGDILKIGFKSNMPCYVRVVYFLAPEPGQSSGDKVLLIDSYKIELDEVDTEIIYPEEFICSEPFGLETMQVFARTQPFEPLSTQSQYGYEFIVDNQDGIRNKSMTKRGFKRQDYSTQVQLSFTTMKK